MRRSPSPAFLFSISESLNLFAERHGTNGISRRDIGNAHTEEQSQKILLIHCPCGKSKTVCDELAVIFFRDHAVSDVEKRTSVLFVIRDPVGNFHTGPHTAPHIRAQRKRKRTVIIAGTRTSTATDAPNTSSVIQ